MPTKLSFVEQALDKASSRQQLRRLKSLEEVQGVRVKREGRWLLNFSSNDYLGLAFDPSLHQGGLEFQARFGNGSTASRLVTGSYQGFAEVEEKLARLKGQEAALVFNSGYQANITLLATLADRKSLILADRLAHNSLIQGAILAGCEFRRFRHNDLDHLAQLLEQSRPHFQRILVVTESVFSMDGDRVDLPRLVELGQEHQAILVVDEAHATGVLGEAGMGLCHGTGVDVVVGTFGKALGSFGAYVAASRPVVDFLITACPGFIYSTALPPYVLGQINQALDLVPQLDQKRQHLQHLAQSLRQGLQAKGYDTGDSTTQIIPVMIGPEAECLELAQRLEDQGFWVVAIRPPTVEPGKARLRISLSALHQEQDVAALLMAFPPRCRP